MKVPHVAKIKGSVLQGLAAAVLALALCVYWATRITTAPILDDAAQSTRMAVNFEHHGVMSVESDAPFHASMYREPVPVLTTALAVAFTDAVLGRAPLADYVVHERAKYLKYQNIAWLGLLAVASFAAFRLFGFSFYLALFGAALVANSMADSLDSLYTEPAAAALTMVFSTLLVVAIRRGHMRWMAAAGLSLGILTLTKAATLYVFVGLFAALLCLYLWTRRSSPQAWGLRELAVLTACFAIVVTPWILRNYALFGTPQITERGGVVLMVRAVKDTMTPEEYRGAFYVWAHERLKPAIGTLLGFSPKDLQRGGRLQRLNRDSRSDFAKDDQAADKQGRPEDAISFYRRGRAERVKLAKEFAAAGDPDPNAAADKELQARALRMILEHPLKHLATTIPFLWRGAAFTFPVMIVAFVCGVWWRRFDYAVFILPTLGTVLFYALLTHFIPRYGVPAVPIAWAVGLIGIKILWSAVRSRCSATRSLNPRVA